MNGFEENILILSFNCLRNTDRIQDFVSFFALNYWQLCHIIECQVLKAGTGGSQQIGCLLALVRLISGYLWVSVEDRVVFVTDFVEMTFSFFDFIYVFSHKVWEVFADGSVRLIYKYWVVLQELSQCLNKTIQTLNNQRIVFEVYQQIPNTINEITVEIEWYFRLW